MVTVYRTYTNLYRVLTCFDPRQVSCPVLSSIHASTMLMCKGCNSHSFYSHDKEESLVADRCQKWERSISPPPTIPLLACQLLLIIKCHWADAFIQDHIHSSYCRDSSPKYFRILFKGTCDEIFSVTCPNLYLWGYTTLTWHHQTTTMAWMITLQLY